ncbi:hypothetical protein [Streptomyces sp. SID3343]|uniref:hypothetical protein n=1 Tax=Streptomyces sp. SID3343 TaxID=2690260 RepID=UPI00136E0B60|nr:hypothetical protein [Streptomyces sp. SID3343]MYV99338.1 hypothetical protein [Streptomyces sp. SID3343]
MNSPTRCLLPALAGWLAFAALGLPEGGPLRIVIVVAFVLCGPGYAVAGGRGTPLATAVTAVATSAALLAITAEAYLLAGAFTAPHVLGTLAGLTTSAALVRTATTTPAPRVARREPR